MPKYAYKARSKSGERKEGVVEGADKRAAMMQIERMGFVPISVREAASAPKGGGKGKPGKDKKGRKAGKGSKPKEKKPRPKLEWRPGRAPRMKLRDVLIFTRELSDLLSSGMQLGQALNTLGNRETGTDEDVIVRSLRDDIIQGSNLSDALGKFPKTFNPLYTSMVRAGEASGAVPETLERLCHHMERLAEAREKVMMALIYPAIVLIAGIGTLILCMVFVIPRFSQIFEDLGSNMPLPTKILIGMSGFLVKYGWIILGICVVGFIMFQRTIATPEGRRWWDGIKLKMPLVKPILTSNAYSQFARTLGGLLENGVPVLQALTIVEDTVGNTVIAEEVREARNRVTDGSTISGPLAQGEKFPRILTDMLAVGEESGDMSGALSHISQRYETELDRNVKVLTSLLEPIMMLGMALMIGFVAVSMLLAVFEMTSGLAG
ncbi:MAG: type II secretion system F family protein [Verrucomicrobiota bacterium]